MVLSATTRTVRVLSAMVLCVLTALPLQGFPSFQKMLSDSGVYSDKCVVSVSSDVVCIAQRQAFERMFQYGGLSWPIASALAVMALAFVGFIFTEVCGSILLAGAALILSDSASSSHEPLLAGFDPYLCGYVLICSGSPFVLAGSLDALASLSQPMPMFTILLICMQLSPLLWPLGIQLLQLNSLLDVFRCYLWIPCIILILTLPLMPFSDTEPISQESSPTPVTRILWQYFPDEEEIEIEETLPPSHFPRKVRSPYTMRFLIFSLGYALSMTVLNSLASTYDIRGHVLFRDQGEDIWKVYAPCIASIAVIPALWTFNKPNQLANSYLGAMLLITVATAMQLQTKVWHIWIAGILLAQVLRVFLNWKMIAIVLKLTGHHYFLVSVGFVWLATSVMQFMIFPSAEYFTIFDDRYIVQASLCLLGAELLVAWSSFKSLRRDWYITRRNILEREACDNAY